MFKLLRCDKGNNPVIKELPVAAGTYAIGEVCSVASGVITKATGTTKPTHVVVEKGTKVVGDTIAVNPIYADMEFLTTFSADASAVVAGAKVTIGSASDTVTATTTNGVATIVEKLGTGASGTEVVVKFV